MDKLIVGVVTVNYKWVTTTTLNWIKVVYA
jgi:hypothetical protein